MKGILFPQESRDISITLDAPRPEMTFTLNWPGSDIGLAVVRPDGRRLDPSTARGISGVDFTYDATTHTRTARVAPAPAGRWTVTLTGTDVEPTGEFFTLTATQALDSPVHIVPFEPRYGVAQPVPLAVTVPRDAGADCRVTARVTDASGRRESIPLADNG